MAAGFVAIGLLAVFTQPGRRVANPVTIDPQPRSLTIFAASHVLPAATLVTAGDIRAKSAGRTALAGAALSAAEILGRVTAKPFAAGEVISRENLRDPSTLGIAARVPAGRRAFSIRVGEDDIVGGFLQTGDRVDVFATIPGSVFPSKSSADLPDRSRTVLLLQDIPVLAVGENPATRGSVQSGARTVSLALAPDALARLALAERYGKVSLAIRMPGDNSIAQAVSAALGDLVPIAPSERSLSTRPLQPRKRHASGIPFYAGVRTSALSPGGLR